MCVHVCVEGDSLYTCVVACRKGEASSPRLGVGPLDRVDFFFCMMNSTSRRLLRRFFFVLLHMKPICVNSQTDSEMSNHFFLTRPKCPLLIKQYFPILLPVLFVVVFCFFSKSQKNLLIVPVQIVTL